MKRVHFDFTISEEDAQTLFDCVTESINDCMTAIDLTKTTKPEIEWFNKRIKYLTELKSKMLNAPYEEFNKGKK